MQEVVSLFLDTIYTVSQCFSSWHLYILFYRFMDLEKWNVRLCLDIINMDIMMHPHPTSCRIHMLLSLNTQSTSEGFLIPEGLSSVFHRVQMQKPEQTRTCFFPTKCDCSLWAGNTLQFIQAPKFRCHNKTRIWLKKSPNQEGLQSSKETCF